MKKLIPILIAAIVIFPTAYLTGQEKQQEQKKDGSAEIKQRVLEVVKNLGSEKYKEREQASAQLKEMIKKTPESLDFLRDALEIEDDPEVKTRLERILKPFLKWDIRGAVLKAVPDIVEKLESDDLEEHQKAARELGRKKPEGAVRLLIRLLIYRNIAVNEWAVRALCMIGEPAVQPLKDAMNDRKNRSRGAAVLVLAKMGNEKGIKYFVDLVKHEDPHARQSAYFILTSIDKPVVKHLTGLLTDDNADVRAFAVAVLGNISHKCVFNHLFRALDDKDERVRRTATRALAPLLDKTMSQRLIEALKHKEGQVRSFAANALGRLCVKEAFDLLTGALNDEDPAVRSSAALALGRIGDTRAVKLMSSLLKDKNRGVRTAAARALGKLGDKSIVAMLAELLQDDNWQIRNAAAESLSRIDDYSVVKPLVDLMSDPEFRVRRTATVALGKIGDSESVAALIRALSEKNYGSAGVAAQVLSEMGEAEAIRPLAEAMRRGNFEDRMCYSRYLAKMGKPAVEVLIKILEDKYKDLYAHAANALGEIGDARAVEPLIKMLGTKQKPYLRGCVVQALGKIGDARAVEPLKTIFRKAQEEKVKFAAAFALLKLSADEDAIKFMTALPNRNDTHHRADAVKALGEWGDERGVDALAQVVKERRSSERCNAVEALGKIGGAKAVGILIQALDDIDDQVRDKAARALGGIGDKRAVEPLIQALKDPYSGTQLECCKALAELGDDRAVEPLIELLGDDDKTGCRYINREAAMALEKLTNQSLGTDYEKWKQWYEKNKGK